MLIYPCYVTRALSTYYSDFFLALLVVCVFVFLLTGKLASVTVLASTADWILEE